MTVKENLVIVTESKTFEGCDNIKIFYENGKAVALDFTYNRGSIGTSIKPEEITDFFDKESKLNFLKELKSNFVMPACTEVLSINQDVFRDSIKRYLLK